MTGGVVARLRSLWRGVRGRPALEADISDEFRLHQELRAADLVREGLAPEAAARQARLEFGSTERYKEEARRSRGLGGVDAVRISWLDVKLGFRMLARYPGLTIVGGLAMAFAIWIGAGAFEFISQVVHPSLPLPAGDRLVGLQSLDVEDGVVRRRIAHDFVQWRDELRTVRDLGAFRTAERNLILAEGSAEPVEVAEMTASGFRATRVAPILGRTLLPSDEEAGAPPVIVIGHDVWTVRFAADPAVVGRTIRVGRTAATIVGVMPAGYRFPIAHDFWVPLRLDVLQHERGRGPDLQVFGRLTPGATLASAQAELATLGRRAAVDFPRTHRHVRPQVMPYARSILNLSTGEAWVVGSTNLFLVMLVVLICGNVALLMFARAATREAEIAVRTALGASRGRIVGQLFVEALVLGGIAAAIGLAAAGAGLRWMMRVVADSIQAGFALPFWFEPRLSSTTLLYAGALTLLGAVIAGVVPGLKVTRGLHARLRESGPGGGGLRFGGVWTFVIVTQVAVTVAFPVASYIVRRDMMELRGITADFPAQELLSVHLEMDRDPPPGFPGDTTPAARAARFQAVARELQRRLVAEPTVAGVTFAERLPRQYHPARLVELDEGGAAPLDPRWPAYRVSSAAVDAEFLATLGAPILAGRGFHASDLDSTSRVVIVNAAFVRRVLGGRPAVGRRIRYLHFEESEEEYSKDARPGPWYQIVGVTTDLGISKRQDPKEAGIYHAAAPGAAQSLHMAVRVRGEAEALAPRLRTIAFDVDPTLTLYQLLPLHELSDAELRFLDYWFRLTLLVSAIAVALSLAGIYAVMSFTVARRTREIGIRVALGAHPRRVLATIFRRPLAQVGSGVAAGGVLVTMLLLAAESAPPSVMLFVGLAGYVSGMFGVCLLACVVPTRCALRIEPTEALRIDA